MEEVLTSSTDAVRVQMWIHDLRVGGAETSLLTEVRAIQGRGIDVTVVAIGNDMTLIEAFREAGVTVKSLGSGTLLSRAHAMWRLLDRTHVDVVNTMLFWPNVLVRPVARMRGIPVLTTLVNAEYGAEHRRRSRYGQLGVLAAQLADIITSRFATRFRAVSDDIAKELSRRLVVPRSKIVTVRRGRDLARLGRRSDERRRAAREQLGVRDEYVLLSLGRQDRQKAQEVAIDALAELAGREGVVLCLVGRPGESTIDIEERLDKNPALRSNVRILGERDDVGDLMSAADAFVFPSRWEGLPGAVIEAMALELPLILSDIPGSREATGGHAWFHQVDDVAGLRKLISAARAGEYPASEVAAARARCEESFSADVVATKMIELFTELARTQR